MARTLWQQQRRLGCGLPGELVEECRQGSHGTGGDDVSTQGSERLDACGVNVDVQGELASAGGEKRAFPPIAFHKRDPGFRREVTGEKGADKAGEPAAAADIEPEAGGSRREGP